jgi:hypothetical protein
MHVELAIPVYEPGPKFDINEALPMQKLVLAPCRLTPLPVVRVDTNEIIDRERQSRNQARPITPDDSGLSSSQDGSRLNNSQECSTGADNMTAKLAACRRTMPLYSENEDGYAIVGVDTAVDDAEPLPDSMHRDYVECLNVDRRRSLCIDYALTLSELGEEGCKRAGLMPLRIAGPMLLHISAASQKWSEGCSGLTTPSIGGCGELLSAHHSRGYYLSPPLTPSIDCMGNFTNVP